MSKWKEKKKIFHFTLLSKFRKTCRKSLTVYINKNSSTEFFKKEFNLNIKEESGGKTTSYSYDHKVKENHEETLVPCDQFLKHIFGRFLSSKSWRIYQIPKWRDTQECHHSKHALHDKLQLGSAQKPRVTNMSLL